MASLVFSDQTGHRAGQIVEVGKIVRTTVLILFLCSIEIMLSKLDLHFSIIVLSISGSAPMLLQSLTPSSMTTISGFNDNRSRSIRRRDCAVVSPGIPRFISSHRGMSGRSEEHT